MRPTVKDVAALAEVSPKTVSNVLTRVVPVSAATRQRVEAAIERLGYVPNLAARGLRSGRSGIVALVMPDLRTSFSAELSHEFVELAHERGLGVQIEESWGDPSRTNELVTAARRHLVDGVVMNPVTAEEGASLVTADPADVPVVVLGEVVLEGVDQVWIDNVDAARGMTAHLIALGHRRIALIGAPGDGLDTETARTRRAGYRRALADAGVPADPRLERACPQWSPRGGAAAMRALLDDGVPFDAVFGCTDSIALGAMSALWSAGLRVPDDVSVAGFDDVEDAEYASPPLTTVHFDKRLYARSALDRLVARMDGSDAPAQRVVVPHRLRERASTRPRAR